MRKQVDEVKKRIAKRRKERTTSGSSSKTIEGRNYYSLPKDEERYGEAPFYDYDFSSNKDQPLFRSDWFILQILLAASLFLVVGILFKDSSPRWDQARAFVIETMEKEFQFAAVLDWYEKQFGKPLALFPEPTSQQKESQYVKQDGPNEPVYAVPAAGRVLEPFSKDRQGIMIETGRDSYVESIDDGVVIEVGVKEDIGKTVVVQHSDGSEAWYGNLDTINVKLYDFVKSRTRIGKVTNTEDGQAGTFYFAFKEGDVFIDPIQVIKFE
ncbi:peptidoglycan DD-metalloendopeptidase family protein [Calidifontibacillus erzurumensis]|uniref:M23 family metallopeptidase n=1 Tax=Calidifontibacillus erzurumensis TaxID=2741433 RepID=A0A8J8GE52_9BACI|nr:peptidoglycan DD-metalloendopeptidase family protein [Calidifontibacillus erzurumensis]NSL50143.1 M23 family metallopeptidase [Calidifontibacillus erzurumensis]